MSVLTAPLEDFVNGCKFFVDGHLTRNAFRSLQKDCQSVAERAIVIVEIDGTKAWNTENLPDVYLMILSSQDRNALTMSDDLKNALERMLREYNPNEEIMWVFTTTGPDNEPGHSHKTRIAYSKAPPPNSGCAEYRSQR